MLVIHFGLSWHEAWNLNIRQKNALLKAYERKNGTGKVVTMDELLLQAGDAP